MDELIAAIEKILKEEYLLPENRIMLNKLLTKYKQL